jgi:hypothetical protein
MLEPAHTKPATASAFRQATGFECRNQVNQANSLHWLITFARPDIPRSPFMNQIIYIVGAIVVVLAILGFFGLR